MTRKESGRKTIKRLYALSGNQCAFPCCKQELFNEEGDNISNVCHIEAANKGGPRYNPQSNDECRRSFANLILLCPNHHKETDNEVDYTLEKLKEMKQNHENEISSKDIFAKNPSILSEAVNLLGTHLPLEKQDESNSNAPNIKEKNKI